LRPGLTATLDPMRPSDLTVVREIRAQLADGSAREARERTGLSAADFAAALGVSRQAVSYWETGRCVPSAEHALAYARLLRQLGKKAA